MKMLRLIGVWFFFFLNTNSLYALDNPKALTPPTHLKVGVLEIRPFSYHKDGALKGFSYELWNQIALENNFACEYVNVGTDVNKAVDMVHDGKLDAVVGPIGVLSSRAALVSFTMPYYRPDFSVIAKKSGVHFWSHFHYAKSNYVFYVLLITLALYFLYLHLFWVFEHHNHKELQSQSYKKGMESLFWKSIFSGLKAPPIFPMSNIMRILSMVWSTIIAIYILSLFAGVTASLVSVFNESDQAFTKKEDLEGKRIAVYGGDTAILNARLANLAIDKVVETVDEGMTLLQENKVDAVFMLRPIAVNYIYKHHSNDLYISPIPFRPIYMSFILNDKYRDLLHGINRSLIKMSEKGNKALFCAKYHLQVNEGECL